MIKILFGIGLTLFVISYGNEIKQFAVETGIRGSVVAYLNSWGNSCRKMPVGLTIQEKCNF